MTAPTVWAGETAPASSPGVWWRRLRLWLVLGVVVLIAVTLYAIFGNQTERRQLDPDSPIPEGSRALAVLLDNHDVAVDEFDDISEAVDAAEEGNATLLVAFPEFLGTRTLQRLHDMPSTTRVVFVNAGPYILDDLDLGIGIEGVEPITRVREPDCDLPEAESAGSAEVGSTRYDVDTDATSCYDDSLVVIPSDGDGPEWVFLGSEDPLTNDRLDEEGNAALSLGLLSAQPRVLWLLPTNPDAEASDDQTQVTLGDLLPGWVGASFLLLVVTAVVSAFWRGRRLGAPIAEPLPVIVRSAETVEGRARLYQRAGARTEAFNSLRAAALSKLLPVLGLGLDADNRAVIAAIAERSGFQTDHVQALLFGPPPIDDARLIAATDALDTLVERTLGLKGPAQ